MTTTYTDESAIVLRSSLPQLVQAYKNAVKDIQAAYTFLDNARDTLKTQFGDKGYGFTFAIKGHDSRSYKDLDKPEELLKEVKRDAWRILIDRMEIRRVLSIQRNDELDKQLETGEGLPEIEEAQILAMLEGTFANIPQLIEEAVREVFDWLRPPGSQYKTNTEFEVGKRVILSYAVSGTWSNNWHSEYRKEQNLRALDNVFHALDGNGTIKSNRGPLIDAICALPLTETTGETSYFRFKCFHNQNLHIEFKRLDLVTRLNQVAGGMRLKPQQQEAA